MPELLTGTVTFFFSDIEGSTRLLRALGDAWSDVLERHQALLRAAVTANGGEEMGTEGDSFFIAFPTAPGALRAAVETQRALAAEAWPEGAQVRVRIGLHTGEASFSADTYAGLHVHRASRIAGVAHGGQVLISSATQALVGQELPEGVELRDLGEHRLKDLEHPERIWQLVIAGLRNDFPPISSLDVTPNNLPTRLTTFLGREREIAEVSDLLADHRLLTLTGPGGTGKTRLSLEVAGRAMRHYPGGVFFVELASIHDPELVIPTVAQALALPDRGGRSVMDRLTDHIGEKHVLLVLDNFEQVIEAAPEVAALLKACPNASIVVSSRSVLQVSGEQEYPVPPLGLPDPEHLPSLAQLSQYEAVALFIERARAVKPVFEVTNENAPAVAELCVRLDGLPLAIELAAARIRVLTPEAMLSRLGDRLGLLAGGLRDRPERQQTLRGAIAWSHDMLEEADRALFAALSVFVGGARLESIERVCASEVEGDLLDSVSSLVEKSLLRQRPTPSGDSRFSMLETIRDFAIEQAVERGSWDALRKAHAEAFAEVAATAAAEVMGASKRPWLDRLEEDHDNLRAAIAWALETGEAAMALRLTATLWRFWQMRGYLAEGLERTDAALAMAQAADHPQLRADALSAAAGLAYWQADSQRSRGFYTQEVEARRALGDRKGLAEATYGLAFTWTIGYPISAEDAGTAALHVKQALDIFTDLGDENGIGRCEWALANIAYGQGDPATTRRHAQHALEVFRKLGDAFMEGWADFTIAIGDLADDAREPSDIRIGEARELLLNALGIFADAGDVSGYTLVLDALTNVAYRRGDHQRAARLNGAVRNLERTTGTGLNYWNRGVLGFDPNEAFSAPELEAARAEGEAMTVDEAVEYAKSG